MKILVVEDDERTADLIEKALKQDGNTVAHAADGEEGLLLAFQGEFDLAIVDIMLPRMDGLSLIDTLRKKQIALPTLVLSARDSVDDRVRGLEAGGDDYLVKPFAITELLARIHAITRRSGAAASTSSLLKVSDIELDLLRRKAFREGKEIVLQPGELMLLEYLMRNAGRVLSKSMIIEHVWDYNFDPETNVIESRICRLRDKIDRPYEKKLLHTVRGFGYVFEDRE